MKLTNVSAVEDFLAVVKECQGKVWLKSSEGDLFNLKSSLSCYVAVGKLISEKGSDLELFCSFPKDEAKFYDFFDQHPDSL